MEPPPPKRAHKRAREPRHISILKLLPCLTGLPEGLSADAEKKILNAYFDTTTEPNLFTYSAHMIEHRHKPYTLILALKEAGAFASHKGRQALLSLIRNARDSRYESGALDALEQHAAYAFSMEADGLSIGCGNVSAEEGVDDTDRLRRIFSEWVKNCPNPGDEDLKA